MSPWPCVLLPSLDGFEQQRCKKDGVLYETNAGLTISPMIGGVPHVKSFWELSQWMASLILAFIQNLKRQQLATECACYGDSNLLLISSSDNLNSSLLESTGKIEQHLLQSGPNLSQVLGGDFAIFDCFLDLSKVSFLDSSKFFLST